MIPASSLKVEEMAGYEQLTDALLRQIRMTADPNLAPAREILERISRRDLYPFIAEFLLEPHVTGDWWRPARAAGDIVRLGEGAIVSHANHLSPNCRCQSLNWPSA